MKIVLNILLFLFISNISFAQLSTSIRTYNNNSWGGSCSCPSGKVLLGNQCIDYVPEVSLSRQSFLEGEINDFNLITMTVNSTKGIKEFSANFKDFFSFVQIKVFELNDEEQMIGSSEINPLLLDRENFEINKVAKKIKIIFIGAAKFPISKPFDLIIKDNDGFQYMKSFPIIIEKDSEIPDSPNKYLKYNMVSIKGPTASGHSPISLLGHAYETKRILKGWRVPILVSYAVKEVICNGSNMNYFAAKINNSESNHISCLQSAKANDGETVFSFANTYSSYNTSNPSSSSAIGGQAFGLKNGLVIDYHNVHDTLAHELGHNLGLFHTFETIANPVRLKSLSEFHQMYKKVNMADNLSYFGDWYPGRLSSNGIINVPQLATIGDDTPTDWYNAKLEGSVSNIALAPASRVIDFSNYSIVLDFTAFSSYGSATNVVYTDFTGQTPTSFSGGFLCQSDRNNNDTGYITICLPGFSLSNNVIENTMSYWRKIPQSSFFSNAQKLRMDYLINYTNDGLNIGEK